MAKRENKSGKVCRTGCLACQRAKGKIKLPRCLEKGEKRRWRK